MPYTYKGSAVIQRTLGANATSQDLFAIENRPGSNVLVVVKRIVIQTDFQNTALTTVMPLVASFRGTGPLPVTNGGITVPKGTFDSRLTSDPNVVLWQDFSSDVAAPGGDMVITPGTTRHWNQFTSRQHTGAGIVATEDDSLLPLLATSSTYKFYLYPGEYYMSEIRSVNAADNPPTTNWFIMVAWTEETLPTYTISGTVTLSGVGVVGAKVTVLVGDDTSMTNAYLHSVQTTIAGGAWSAAIPMGKVAYAYAQNYTGGTYYTAPGNPYVTGT